MRGNGDFAAAVGGRVALFALIAGSECGAGYGDRVAELVVGAGLETGFYADSSGGSNNRRRYDWREEASERRQRLNLYAAWLVVRAYPSRHRTINELGRIVEAETGLTDKQLLKSITAITETQLKRQFVALLNQSPDSVVGLHGAFVDYFLNNPMPGEYCALESMR